MTIPPAGGPEQRIGDAEREAAVTALGEHYAAGRLTKEEYDERSDAAWAARTGSSLRPLFADLPGSTGPSDASVPESRPPGPPRGRHGWHPRAGLVPVLVAVVALVAFTRLPVFVLLLVFWLLWARVWRFRAGTGHRHHHGRRDQWVR